MHRVDQRLDVIRINQPLLSLRFEGVPSDADAGLQRQHMLAAEEAARTELGDRQQVSLRSRDHFLETIPQLWGLRQVRELRQGLLVRFDECGEALDFGLRVCVAQCAYLPREQPRLRVLVEYAGLRALLLDVQVSDDDRAAKAGLGIQALEIVAPLYVPEVANLLRVLIAVRAIERLVRSFQKPQQGIVANDA
eukprot:CAMPEP_0176020918 /NCGR_PEP_ID=MMETSP0120_2-20121206/10147_1 /TAXON_ID=160619 /ORGANISM="Kryptoperidinium foliaceum, Strain CCMP 1326" /LENGTH=192 /DNA_ID=CAMNT_0017354027 /DNA_START=298 /DNA_END=873 /DNA_ORIENTATION=+